MATRSTAMETDEFVADLEKTLKKDGLDRREHPFVSAVYKGEASKDQIAGWMNQLRLWATPSNKLLGVLYATCPDDDLREAILENIMEEESGDTSGAGGHVQLIEDTIRELGWSDERRDQDSMKLESWALQHWLEVVMRSRSFVEGICAVSFAMERLNPDVFDKIHDGLKRHYDLSKEGMESIAVHASHVEEEHGMLGPTAMERYAQSAPEQDAVRFSVVHTAELYYAQYDVWGYYQA